MVLSGEERKECQREKQREKQRNYCLRHPDRVKESSRKYREKHPELCRERVKRCGRTPEKSHEYNSRFYRKHREKCLFDRWKWRQMIIRKVVTYYSNGTMSCACCGESNPIALTVDHIDGGGLKHRKEIGRGNLYYWLVKNNFPKGFQILCFNCNQGKYRNGGWCYHWDDVCFKEGSIYPCKPISLQGG